MKYVALLRGINVGGNRKVDMRQLKDSFELAGMTDVRTYINSGNVIFSAESTDSKALAKALEQAIETDFGFPVRVLLRDASAMAALVQSLGGMANDTTTKCDVLLLAPEIDSPAIVEQLSIKPDIDHATYVPGAVLWHVDRDKVTRSGLVRIVGTELYAQMTVRNCNTIRKLAELMR